MAARVDAEQKAKTITLKHKVSLCLVALVCVHARMDEHSLLLFALKTNCCADWSIAFVSSHFKNPLWVFLSFIAIHLLPFLIKKGFRSIQHSPIDLF